MLSSFAFSGTRKVAGHGLQLSIRPLSSLAPDPFVVSQDDNEKAFKTLLSLASALKPREVVDQLNKFIIGQGDAKRAVAIALRNRWRRHHLNEDFRNEVIPKNILMVGPTGCGKTEIARRIAKLSQAPFIKVEATKFTETGFHGKDVDSIIKDLVEISITMIRKRLREEKRATVQELVEERLLSLLLGDEQGSGADRSSEREKFRGMLKNRDPTIEVMHVDVDVPSKTNAGTGGMSFEGAQGTDTPFQVILAALNKKKGSSRRRMTVSEARTIVEEQEIDRAMQDYDIHKEAITAVEQSGIVFIDEIDKIISSDHRGGSADASAEGVQRDLLPLIEGTTIATKHGNVNTDFILFIASGAFHSNKPSNLLAELQGRLPIRVTLQGLTENDFYRILTEPVTNLLKQQVELMKAEKVELEWKDDAIREIARVTFMTNKTVENIGARRLHTVIERVMEDISFRASELTEKKVEIDAKYVQERVKDLLDSTDLKKYIL